MIQLEPMQQPQPSPGSSGVFGYRKRPAAPRNIQTRGPLVMWDPPVDKRGVFKHRVYLDSESNLVFESNGSKASKKQTYQGIINSIKLKNIQPNTPHVAFVSTVSDLGRESPKIPVSMIGSVVALAAGIAVSPTTTSAFPNWVDLPDLAITQLTHSQNVLINFWVTANCNNPGADIFYSIWRDGVQISPVAMSCSPIAGQNMGVSAAWIDTVPPLSHTWKIRWCLNSAGPTATANLTDRAVQVVELD